jgi:hypothetical protein
MTELDRLDGRKSVHGDEYVGQADGLGKIVRDSEKRDHCRHTQQSFPNEDVVPPSRTSSTAQSRAPLGELIRPLPH